MVTVTASIGIPIEMWQKCQKYRINRSAVARSAIGKEIERIEKETGGSRQANTPAATPCLQGA
jgi:post-segregation antitoxin (ccd killing protein)